MDLQQFLVRAPALEAKFVRKTECVNEKATLSVLNELVLFWVLDYWGRARVICLLTCERGCQYLVMPLVLRLTNLDGPMPSSHHQIWPCREARWRMDG